MGVFRDDFLWGGACAANQENMRRRVFYTTDVQVRGAYGCWCKRFWEDNDIHLVWEPATPRPCAREPWTS